MLRRIIGAGAVVLACSLALYAQQQPQQPQQPQNPQPQNPTYPRSTSIDDRSDKGHMTAQKAAEMFRSAKHSLSDSIRTAEQRSGGKAVSAYCCMKSKSDVKKWPAGRPDVRRGGTPDEGRRDDQGRETRDTARDTGTDKAGPVCVVTCLVGDNRLMEIAICSESNEVLAEYPVESVSSIYARTDAR